MQSARLVFGAALLAIVTAPGVSTTAGPADPTPTFNKDVAPILYSKCASCHRPEHAFWPALGAAPSCPSGAGSPATTC